MRDISVGEKVPALSDLCLGKIRNVILSQVISRFSWRDSRPSLPGSPQPDQIGQATVRIMIRDGFAHLVRHGSSGLARLDPEDKKMNQNDLLNGVGVL